MRVVISQKSLLESLKTVSRAVSGHNTLPVLGNILIRAEGKKVYFAATNLEVSITTSVEADVKNEGSITVPSKILTSYTSLLGKGDDLELRLVDGLALEIKSKGSKTKIKGISADEFPNISRVDSGVRLSLKAEDFRATVSQVAFAAQENSARPILSGVFFGVEKGTLRVAATDSYRLSEKRLTIETAKEDKNCVIPVRAIFEADRLVVGSEKVNITISENQVMFAVGGTELVSRLIDGQFPDYQQIVPKKSSTQFSVNRAEFELSVRRVSIFAKENNQHMKMEILNDGSLTVYTDATEVGEERTTMSVKMTGDTMVIALNADYVLDILGALSTSENIHLELDGKMSPAVFKPEKAAEFIHLIMPLKM